MKINEIFYSLQGEGFWTGTPIVFVRFASCNLNCSFCDTDWTGFKEMTPKEIVTEILRFPARRVCLTGGEPCLQATSEFVELLHQEGFTVHMETNGTILPPQGIDWITLSPKDQFVSEAKPVLKECNELKVLFPSNPQEYDCIRADYRFLQPIDSSDKQLSQENLKSTMDYLMEHPEWRLSLQTHKILNIK